MNMFWRVKICNISVSALNTSKALNQSGWLSVTPHYSSANNCNSHVYFYNSRIDLTVLVKGGGGGGGGGLIFNYLNPNKPCIRYKLCSVRQESGLLKFRKLQCPLLPIQR